MQFVLDVHVHTINSTHAYSTLSENAEYAADIGLECIGIADHGPGMPGGAHLYHFINLYSLPDTIKGVRVLKGAEANIMNTEGELDLPASVLSKLDFVIAAMHRAPFPPTNSAEHTQAMIKAMENPNVHILGHPGDSWFDIDIEAVVAAAARTRTIIEINNQSLNANSPRFNGYEPYIKILSLCRAMEVPVLASSDAHFCTSIGDVDKARALIESSGLSEAQVVNTGIKRFLDAVAEARTYRA